MNPEERVKLYEIAADIKHVREVVDLKIGSLDSRVTRLERGTIGVVLAFFAAAFGWIFKRS